MMYALCCFALLASEDYQSRECPERALARCRRPLAVYGRWDADRRAAAYVPEGVPWTGGYPESP